MIRIGLIGCGKISRAHIKAFASIDGAEITCVCDISEENLKAACEATGAVGYADYKEMVKNEDIDLAVITLPHGLHGEAACFCAECGVDVFLEKPMGISSDDCKRMIDACKKAGVMLWVGHPQCYVPANVFAKSLIDSGEYGSLVSFLETRNVNYFADSRPRWFLKKSMSGGGIMINLGAHSLDKLKFFSGSEISEVSGGVHIREGYDCEDSAQAFVKTQSGVTGIINLIGHTAANMNPTVLYLERGEIRIATNGTVEYCGADGVFKSEQHPGSGMEPQLRAVIKAMQGGKKPHVSGEYGLNIISTVKRLYGDEK